MDKLPTILVVDDHPATRKLLQEILRNDYNVLLASNGEEALQHVTSQQVDLVLLDIIMPGIDGYETCRQIKRLKGLKEIPIIFLSVLGEDYDEAKGFAVGVSDYVIKPISRLRLLARVKNQIQLREQQRKLKEQNKQLQEALGQIKTLRGILPICSYCKQIRNDKGNWLQIEEYIRNHSSADFSHGICPDCANIHHPEIMDSK